MRRISNGESDLPRLIGNGDLLRMGGIGGRGGRGSGDLRRGRGGKRRLGGEGGGEYAREGGGVYGLLIGAGGGGGSRPLLRYLGDRGGALPDGAELRLGVLPLCPIDLADSTRILAPERRLPSMYLMASSASSGNT